MKKEEWAAIKQEYVSTTISLAKLAENHGVSVRTIKARSAKEHWVEERKNFCSGVALKVSRKSEAAEVRRLARLQGTTEDLAALIEVDVKKIMAEHEGLEKITGKEVKVIRDIAAALKDVAATMRDVYGIPNVREELLIEKYAEYKKTLEIKAEAAETEENSTGVILLPERKAPPMPPEEGGADDADSMGTTAETT